MPKYPQIPLRFCSWSFLLLLHHVVTKHFRGPNTDARPLKGFSSIALDMLWSKQVLNVFWLHFVTLDKYMKWILSLNNKGALPNSLVLYSAVSESLQTAIVLVALHAENYGILDSWRRREIIMPSRWLHVFVSRPRWSVMWFCCSQVAKAKYQWEMHWNRQPVNFKTSSRGGRGIL